MHYKRMNLELSLIFAEDLTEHMNHFSSWFCAFVCLSYLHFSSWGISTQTLFPVKANCELIKKRTIKQMPVGLRDSI